MTRRAFLLLGTAVVVTGCERAARPPQIRYGRDLCDYCGMIISEARFAAAYVTRQGEVRRFDDIGDMLAFFRLHREDVAVFWVHDYETEEWIKADGAFFVMSSKFPTPMGHGIIALGSKERAERFAAPGEVLTFAEVLARHAN